MPPWLKVVWLDRFGWASQLDWQSCLHFHQLLVTVKQLSPFLPSQSNFQLYWSPCLQLSSKIGCFQRNLSTFSNQIWAEVELVSTGRDTWRSRKDFGDLVSLWLSKFGKLSQFLSIHRKGDFRLTVSERWHQQTTCQPLACNWDYLGSPRGLWSAKLQFLWSSLSAGAALFLTNQNRQFLTQTHDFFFSGWFHLSMMLDFASLTPGHFWHFAPTFEPKC